MDARLEDDKLILALAPRVTVRKKAKARREPKKTKLPLTMSSITPGKSNNNNDDNNNKANANKTKVSKKQTKMWLRNNRRPPAVKINSSKPRPGSPQYRLRSVSTKPPRRKTKSPRSTRWTRRGVGVSAGGGRNKNRNAAYSDNAIVNSALNQDYYGHSSLKNIKQMVAHGDVLEGANRSLQRVKQDGKDSPDDQSASSILPQLPVARDLNVLAKSDARKLLFDEWSRLEGTRQRDFSSAVVECEVKLAEAKSITESFPKPNPLLTYVAWDCLTELCNRLSRIPILKDIFAIVSESLFVAVTPGKGTQGVPTLDSNEIARPALGRRLFYEQCETLKANVRKKTARLRFFDAFLKLGAKYKSDLRFGLASMVQENQKLKARTPVTRRNSLIRMVSKGKDAVADGEKDPKSPTPANAKDKPSTPVDELSITQQMELLEDDHDHPESDVGMEAFMGAHKELVSHHASPAQKYELVHHIFESLSAKQASGIIIDTIIDLSKKASTFTSEFLSGLDKILSLKVLRKFISYLASYRHRSELEMLMPSVSTQDALTLFYALMESGHIPLSDISDPVLHIWRTTRSRVNRSSFLEEFIAAAADQDHAMLVNAIGGLAPPPAPGPFKDENRRETTRQVELLKAIIAKVSSDVITRCAEKLPWEKQQKISSAFFHGVETAVQGETIVEMVQLGLMKNPILKEKAIATFAACGTNTLGQTEMFGSAGGAGSQPRHHFSHNGTARARLNSKIGLSGASDKKRNKNKKMWNLLSIAESDQPSALMADFLPWFQFLPDRSVHPFQLPPSTSVNTASKFMSQVAGSRVAVCEKVSVSSALKWFHAWMKAYARYVAGFPRHRTPFLDGGARREFGDFVFDFLILRLDSFTLAEQRIRGLIKTILAHWRDEPKLEMLGRLTGVLDHQHYTPIAGELTAELHKLLLDNSKLFAIPIGSDLLDPEEYDEKKHKIQKEPETDSENKSESEDEGADEGELILEEALVRPDVQMIPLLVAITSVETWMPFKENGLLLAMREEIAACFSPRTSRNTLRDVKMVSMWDVIMICMRYWQVFTEMQARVLQRMSMDLNLSGRFDDKTFTFSAFKQLVQPLLKHLDKRTQKMHLMSEIYRRIVSMSAGPVSFAFVVTYYCGVVIARDKYFHAHSHLTSHDEVAKVFQNNLEDKKEEKKRVRRASFQLRGVKKAVEKLKINHAKSKMSQSSPAPEPEPEPESIETAPEPPPIKEGVRAKLMQHVTDDALDALDVHTMSTRVLVQGYVLGVWKEVVLSANLPHENRLGCPLNATVLAHSPFAKRAEDPNDAEQYYDSFRKEKLLEHDWSLLWKKSVFSNKMLLQVHHKNKELFDRDVGQLKEEIKLHLDLLYALFDYYACCSGPEPFKLTSSGFTDLMRDAQILNRSTQLSQEMLDTVFFECVSADHKAHGHHADAKPSKGHNALKRFELIEAVIRISLARYISTKARGGGSSESGLMTTAVRQLITKHFRRFIKDPKKMESSDRFRRNRLYVRKTVELLKGYVHKLQAIFDKRRSVKTKAGGMTMTGWIKLLDNVGLIDSDLSNSDAKLCFVRAQMLAYRHGGRAKTLNFVDFLEAMFRVSETKPLPSQLWMETMGVPDLYTYYFGKRTWHKDIRVAKEVGSDLKPGIQLSRVLDLFFRVLREGIRPCFKTKS